MIATLFWLCIASVAYTYAGYPLVLTFLNKLRRPWQAPATVAELPSVTLLIAAYNEEAEIAAKLENSLNLDYPAELLQILVVADGSADRTPDVVRGFAERGVELSFSPPRRGKMAAINRALPECRGAIIIFSDANNRYSPNVIRDLVAPFADPSVGAATGAKIIAKGDGALGESEGLYWRYESFVKQQETNLGCCMGVAGEILAIRRDLFESPPDAIINDDTHMALRLVKRGFRVIYVPQARSTERVSLSASDERARRARIFAGRYQAITFARDLWPWNHPLRLWQIWSHQTIRTLSALGMAGAFVLNLIAVVVPRRRASGLWQLGKTSARGLFAAQAIFYLLALFGVRASSGSRLSRIAYLPTFFLNLNWAGLIGFYRFATRRQTTLWQRAKRRG